MFKIFGYKLNIAEDMFSLRVTGHVMSNVCEYFLAKQIKYLAVESYRLLQHMCTKDQQYSCTDSSELSQISARP